jgi:hypothetical protein
MTENIPENPDVTIEQSGGLAKKTLSHTKLSSLAKARSEKQLKSQQQNYKDEMMMTTLNHINEKLNLIDSKLYSFGGMKRTLDNLAEAEVIPKKAKLEETPDTGSYGIVKYLPQIGLLIVGSVATRYATNKIREFLVDGERSTTDRDNIPWSGF